MWNSLFGDQYSFSLLPFLRQDVDKRYYLTWTSHL